MKSDSHALPGNENTDNNNQNDHKMTANGVEKENIFAEAYVPPDPGPYPQDQPKKNSVRFTPTQVLMITSQKICICKLL